MVPRPNIERIPDMPAQEHTQFGLIIVREFSFCYVRELSDQLYQNYKPTTLEESS
jgi:hypothetical protein